MAHPTDILLEHAPEMLEEWRSAVLGLPQKYPDACYTGLQDYFNMCKAIAIDTGFSKKISARSAGQVMDLLSDGKISVMEAERLMTLLDKAANITKLAELHDTLQALEQAKAGRM